MANSNVPKFGNWEDQEDVPYTAYFDKARKVRTKPNQSKEVSDLYSQNPLPSPSRPKSHQEDVIRSSEDSEFKNLSNSPGHPNGQTSRQVKDGSNNNSYERSPLHNQAKASPFRDGKSKPRSAQKGDQSPEKGVVVPKFGDWDENNPASADGYTNIFNQVREERTSGSDLTRSSRTPTHSAAQRSSDSSKFCCFGWRRK